jgi:hypothetical protein
MEKTKSGNWKMTKAERQARWDKCTRYLLKHGSIPEAQAAAKRDGVSFDFSVWLSALDKMLQQGQRPGQEAT